MAFFLSTLILLLSACVTTDSTKIQEERMGDRYGISSVAVKGGINDDGWGSGFFAKTRSGKTVIVSAAHVCVYSEDKKSVLIVEPRKSHRTYKAKILMYYDRSDVCVIDAPMGGKALKIAEKVFVRESIYSIAYPYYMWDRYPMQTITTGLIRGIAIGESWMPKHFDIDKCRGKAFKWHDREPDNNWWNDVGNCYLKVKMYTTSLPIAKGASGGPVVNTNGEVIGLNSLADFSALNNAYLVKHDHIRDALNQL